MSKKPSWIYYLHIFQCFFLLINKLCKRFRYIVVNVLICCYFRHHRKLNEIDPTTGEKRLYNKDWGVTKPTQTLFVPMEQNQQNRIDDPVEVNDYDD